VLYKAAKLLGTQAPQSLHFVSTNSPMCDTHDDSSSYTKHADGFPVTEKSRSNRS